METNENNLNLKVENKIPLGWLIGSAITVTFALGANFALLQGVNEAVRDMRVELKDRNAQVTSLSQSVAMHEYKLENVVRDVEEIKRNVRTIPVAKNAN